MNKLYNDTAVQAIANAIRAKNGSSDTYTIAEMSTALNDLSYYAKPTISNVALATFEADGMPLNSLKVSVEAKQASGTPSPSNPLPISGWDNAIVTDTDDVDNPTVTQTTTISLGQTVYDGDIDVINGGGNSNTVKLSLAEICTNTQDFGDYVLFYSNDLSSYGVKDIPSSSSDFYGLCDTYKMMAYNSEMHATDNSIAVRSDNTRKAVYVRTDGTSQTLPTGYVLLELATPTTFTTQPTPIKSLNGINNLSVDCGDVIELEYFKEV